MLAIGYNRKHPERCDAVYEVIKATLFSSYRGIHLFLNDSIRMFYGSVQHRYLYGVLKALNPKRDIDISFACNGLMPKDGNVDTINTREHEYKILGNEISHISASSCVPVDPNSKDPPQDEIDTKAKELYKSWDKARQIPEKYKDAITRGKEYAIDEKERQLTKRGYTAAVKNSRNRLKDLGFDQLTMNDQNRLEGLDFDKLTLHERSQTVIYYTKTILVPFVVRYSHVTSNVRIGEETVICRCCCQTVETQGTSNPIDLTFSGCSLLLSSSC